MNFLFIYSCEYGLEKMSRGRGDRYHTPQTTVTSAPTHYFNQYSHCRRPRPSGNSPPSFIFERGFVPDVCSRRLRATKDRIR